MTIVASWNVNSLSVRLPQLTDWLNKHKPNIVCLQETKLVDDKFPRAELEKLGYYCDFFGEKTYNGVAVLSDKPIDDVHKGLEEEVAPASKRLMEVRIEDLYILNAYIPNGQEVGSQKYEYKLKWLSGLLNHLEKRHTPESSVILCGDFNIATENRDVYLPDAVDGTIMVSDTERQELDKIRQWGFVDTFRLHNEQGGLFSWWDYRQGAFRRNMGFRIDHIWATPPLAQRCTGAWIDKEPRKLERPSDHAPVLAEFADE